MIKLKRIWVMLAAIALVFAFMLPTGVTGYAMAEKSTVSTASDVQITTRAAVIEYRYKTVDGKVYRRLYNYTYQRWEGEWEQCP